MPSACATIGMSRTMSIGSSSSQSLCPCPRMSNMATRANSASRGANSAHASME